MTLESDFTTLLSLVRQVADDPELAHVMPDSGRVRARNRAYEEYRERRAAERLRKDQSA